MDAFRGHRVNKSPIDLRKKNKVFLPFFPLFFLKTSPCYFFMLTGLWSQDLTSTNMRFPSTILFWMTLGNAIWRLAEAEEEK